MRDMSMKLILSNLLDLDLDAMPHMVIGDTQYGEITCGTFDVKSPLDGDLIATFPNRDDSQNEVSDVNTAIDHLQDSFNTWRMVPAPKRGEVVRRIGEKVRANKDLLTELVMLEIGKTRSEAAGEVQEWIDICEFATGLSRQLYGLTIASERPNHRLMEQWHPLGVVGVITAFNFSIGVWAWNAMIGLVCGNVMLWKPSEKASVCAIACHNIVQQVLASFLGSDDEVDKKIAMLDLSAVIVGFRKTGEDIAKNKRIPLVSATGSTRMGKEVAATVGARLGRSLLELGGNNAIIVTPTADIELAVRTIAFAVVGTAGQRCTTARRIIVHVSKFDELLNRLIKAFDSVSIGDPRDDKNIMMGPLIDENAYNGMQSMLEANRAMNIDVIGGQRVTECVPAGGFYVKPAIVVTPNDNPNMQLETFAPIVYLTIYKSGEIEEAIAINNHSSYGLSSAILTDSLTESEKFLSAAGSDCGIANVNVSTSGAEIGGAFGGEKDTGGGRESGSDAWKNYMRRQTVTIKGGGGDLTLSQGIKFDV